MSEPGYMFINELIYKSLEGKLSEDENRVLNDFVSQPKNIAYYYKSLRLHEALKKRLNLLNEKSMGEVGNFGLEELAFYEKIAPSVELPEEEPQRELIQKVVYPPREKYKMSKFNLFMLVMSAAAVLFVVLFIKFAPVKNQNVAPVNNQYHAVITDSVNAKWSDDLRPDGIGEELSLDDGDLWLQSGFVKLLFGSGAEVIIESPARFEVLSATELNVINGRTYSKVPERAKGFTVLTPNSQVIDLGTEFGVEVLGGSSSVHMVKGKASVLPENGLRTQKPIELTAGYAKLIDQEGILQDTRIDDKKFVADISSKMGMIYRADKAIPVGIWDRRFTEDLTKDLRTDGSVICAVNLGPQSVKPATVCGITFNPLTQGGIVTGGAKEVITNNFTAYNGSNQDMVSLLTSGRTLGKNNTSTKIQIDELNVGRAYRIQLIFNFPWGWTDVNCYGTNREHMYFANTISSGAELGLATYRWKAKSTTEEITVTFPRPKPGEWNFVSFVGYVVHEVNQGGLESL